MTIQENVEEIQEKVLEFQELKALSISEPQDSLIKERLEHCVEQIWLQIREDLLDLASQWLRSELGRNLSNQAALADAKLTLALIAFEAIFLRLASIKIDPMKNLKALLIVIGKRGLYNENRIYLPNGARSIETLEESQSTSNPEKESMWEPRKIEKHAPTPEDLVDPKSFDWENRLIESFDMVRYGPAIRTAISQLSSREQLVIELRFSEPSTPYKVIAEILNKKDAAIRQCCKRALQKIYQYLVSAGLVE